MGSTIRVSAVCLLATVVMSGCATKGALRTAVAEQQAALAATNAALETERTQRMAADERLASDLATLRNDLQSMRTEFNASIQAVAQGLQFVMPVHFAFDEAAVREADITALNRFGDVVSKHYTGAIVTIEGFADPAGSPRYNTVLSQKRAEAVRDYLMQRGIQAQLKVVGYGEDRQVVPGAQRDDPGAELNRRVVFVVETPAASRPVTLLDRTDG